MKSGMRSTGLNAYAAMASASTRTSGGVRGSRAAKYTVKACCFSAWAFVLNEIASFVIGRVAALSSGPAARGVSMFVA